MPSSLPQRLAVRGRPRLPRQQRAVLAVLAVPVSLPAQRGPAMGGQG